MKKALQTYTEVLGGGGYGVVMGSELNPDYAIKFLYNSQCASAKKEYIKGREVYNALKIFISCNDGNDMGISVAKPVEFVQKEKCTLCDYSCMLVMERVYSPLFGINGQNENYASHIILNDSFPVNMLNTLVLTKNGNPRGYFYGPDFILQHTSLTLPYITYRIGLLEGISIFGAMIVPKDVEYLLTEKHGQIYITMVDFGMFYNVNSTTTAEDISNEQEYNLYYHPYSELIPVEYRDECRDAFIKGITDTFNCFEREDMKDIYDDLINIYRG